MAVVSAVVVVRDVEPVPVLETAAQRGIDPEVLPLPAPEVVRPALAGQVPLAHPGGAVAGVAKRMGDGTAPRREQVTLHPQAVHVGILAGHQPGTERHAHRIVAHRVRAAHASSRQPIQVGGRHVAVSVAGQRVVAKLVAEQPQQIRSPGHLRRRYHRIEPVERSVPESSNNPVASG